MSPQAEGRPIVQQIDRDLTEALKAREAERLGALRMVKTALKLRETEVPGSLGDEDALRVLNTLIKQRRDAAEQFRAAGREDLAQKEEREAQVIQAYLPRAASPEDMVRAVEDAVAETGATSPREMGAVMKAARARLRHPRLRFEAGNAEALALPDGAFDLACCFTVFTSIHDAGMASRVAAELDRVLAPGGAVVWYDFRVDNPANATLLVHFDYGVDRGRERVTSTPGFGYGDPFFSPWYSYPVVYRGRHGHRFIGYSPYRPWGFGWYDPFFGGPDVQSYTVYTSGIDLKIDRASDGARLFEGKAQAVSTSNRLPYLVPNLIEAMFTDFPGDSGQTVRISIAPEKQPVKRTR